MTLQWKGRLCQTLPLLCVLSTILSGCGGNSNAINEQKKPTVAELQVIELESAPAISELEVIAEISTDSSSGEDVDTLVVSNEESGQISLPSTEIIAAEIEIASEEQLEEQSEEIRPGCIGNYAWMDENRDGLQTPGEVGAPPLEIHLITMQGETVDTVSTDGGYFEVCASAGMHELQVALPAQYHYTNINVGNDDTIDSDITDTGLLQVLVESGIKKTSIDIGLIENSSVVSETEPELLTQVESESEVNTDQSVHEILKWGFWGETRNAYPANGVAPPNDEGVETIFDRYSFAHVKGLSLQAVNGDASDRSYVVNVLNAARQFGVSLDIQLGSSSEYGWNFNTNRGNFKLDRWWDAISRFNADDTVSFHDTSQVIPGDPIAFTAIQSAIADGTIRYIFLIDEPNHKRWSPGWDGTTHASASGNSNHVTNEDLDAMAAYVKSLWGPSVRTIVRTAPVNLISATRGGVYEFQHMTHAYFTLSSAKWPVGANKGPGKGFEWFLVGKNNHTDNLTNLAAYNATNLKMSFMVQAGFESKGNPWTGEKNFASQWWKDDIRYPYRGVTSYVKSAPAEMDFWIKSMLSPRDPLTGELSETGTRLINEFVIFRADRLPTDSGKLPFTTYPHYRAFLDQLTIDMQERNFTPTIGIPVGWEGE